MEPHKFSRLDVENNVSFFISVGEARELGRRERAEGKGILRGAREWGRRWRCVGHGTSSRVPFPLQIRRSFFYSPASSEKIPNLEHKGGIVRRFVKFKLLCYLKHGFEFQTRFHKFQYFVCK